MKTNSSSKLLKALDLLASLLFVLGLTTSYVQSLALAELIKEKAIAKCPTGEYTTKVLVRIGGDKRLVSTETDIVCHEN